MVRFCRKCGVEVPSRDFIRTWGNICHPCRKILAKTSAKRCRARLREADPEKLHRISKHFRLKSSFGLTLGEYYKLSENQYNKCKICGKAAEDNGKALAVDHDHISGKIRGLLCHHCNVGLGHFNENLDVLKAAIGYLNAHAAE